MNVRVGDTVLYRTRLGVCPAIVLTPPNPEGRVNLRIFIPMSPDCEHPSFQFFESYNGTALRTQVSMGTQPGTYSLRV